MQSAVSHTKFLQIEFITTFGEFIKRIICG